MSSEVESKMPKYLTVKEVACLTGMSVQFWDKLRSTGGGPVHVRLSAKAIRYREADIHEWMASRLRASTFDDRKVAA